jgi:hypothetical protein
MRPEGGRLRRLGIAAVVIASLLWALGIGTAQDAPLRVEGRVAWIAGQTLVIVPDGSPSITIDLSQVPQEQRTALREGDRVIVSGAVTNERNRVVAASVERLTP